MEELKRVQELRVDESSSRRLIENQDTINELTARLQELQNEVICLNASRDFKDAESVRSGLHHVPCQQASLPPFRDPGGMLSRKDEPPNIWDTLGISGNVFVDGGRRTQNEEKFKKTFLENQTGFHQPPKQEVIAHKHSLFRNQ